MTKRILFGCAVAVSAMTIAANAASRITPPVEHFTARAVEATSPARINFHRVEIVISRWSTFTDHRQLMATLLMKGSVAFLSDLCGFAPAGTISIVGRPDVPIRYAWSIEERGGSRRIYLATDEPMSLGNPLLRRFPDAEPLTFIELRVSRNGEGEGKMSEALQLSVDESRGVIELRDYDKRPLHLVMVRSVGLFEE
jgi:hypothetical protein